MELINATSTVAGAPRTIPSDAELIECVRRREEPALGTIYDRYARLVYTIALRITGDRESAEEVTQDVFQAVWQSAAGFHLGGSLSAWLIGITRHRAIDLTRSRRYRSRSREEVLDDQIAGPTTSFDGTADAFALREMMRRALSGLSPVQRQAIELAYYGGLTYVEIANRIGEPIGTVKSRMRVGLMRLRELLGTSEE